MARRESQGLQIALIVLVMVTVLLAVFTYMFWSQSRQRGQQLAKLEGERNSAMETATSATFESEELKKMLGMPESSLDEIRKKFDQDMATYVGSLPEERRNYTEVPVHLLQTLQERYKRISDLNEQVGRLNDELQAARDEAQQQLAAAKDLQAKTEADLRKVRSDFENERSRMNQEKSQLAAQVDSTQKEKEQLQAESEQQIAQLEQERNNLRAIRDDRDRKIREMTDENFETPDGRITWINPQTGTVYINLGSSDGLRRQVTFSVFGVDANNLAREKPKGRIEVTRVANANMSEAQITDDDVLDPILPGDVIYTPLWNSKSGLHMALAGFMDINGDGRDDRQLIRNLITLNGGVVDAEDTAQGVQGRITRHTRYLIRGDEPAIDSTATIDAAEVEARQRAWTTLIDQATENGVEEMSIERMMEFMGYDGEKRTIPLGRGSRYQDFSGKADGVIRSSPGLSSETFRRRPPPVTNRTN